MMIRNTALLAALVSLLALASSAQAQVALPDMTADIAAVQAFIVLVGGGVLTLIFSAKAFRWARRAG
jgi:O-acetyl-ADP-ribose deacetylase (regulator of RNase III)